MSNEAKDYQFDVIQDVVIERGLVDTVTAVYPNPEEGWPQYVEGIKNGQRVKYYVKYMPEEGWLCEHRELDHFD